MIYNWLYKGASLPHITYYHQFNNFSIISTMIAIVKSNKAFMIVTSTSLLGFLFCFFIALPPFLSMYIYYHIFMVMSILFFTKKTKYFNKFLNFMIYFMYTLQNVYVYVFYFLEGQPSFTHKKKRLYSLSFICTVPSTSYCLLYRQLSTSFSFENSLLPLVYHFQTCCCCPYPCSLCF